MKIVKELKGVFKPPVKKYYLGKIKYHTPYFYPRGFCDTIISVLKLIPLTEEALAKNAERGFGWAKKRYSNMPMVRRTKNWIINIFGNEYYIQLGLPFKINSRDVGWKDKWHSPRFEWSPSYQIWFFKWQFVINWRAPGINIYDDDYWEMVLWYLYYADKDINKAQETWGWTSGKNNESTWNPKYLI